MAMTVFDIIYKGGGHELSKYLDENPAEANAKDHDGCSPLRLALLIGQVDDALCLIEHGADVKETPGFGSRDPVLFEAVRGGYLDVVKEMVVSDPRILLSLNADDQNALHIAAKFDRGECYEFLIRSGADEGISDADGNRPLEFRKASALREAVSDADADGVKAILDANPEMLTSKMGDGLPATSWAVANGDCQGLRILLDRGAKVAPPSEIFSAVASGNPEIVSILLDLGIDPDLRGDQGLTPLHNAAITGDFRVAKVLIEQGADPNSQTDEGLTALHILVTEQAQPSKEFIELILSHGGRLDIRDDDGRRATDIDPEAFREFDS